MYNNIRGPCGAKSAGNEHEFACFLKIDSPIASWIKTRLFINNKESLLKIRLGSFRAIVRDQ